MRRFWQTRMRTPKAQDGHDRRSQRLAWRQDVGAAGCGAPEASRSTRPRVVAAALSRDENRAIDDPALAPGHLTGMLRLRACGLAAVERQPSLAERMREAVLGPRGRHALPVAA